MSKKTKLEKIIAKERRKYQIASQLDNVAVSSQYSFKSTPTKANSVVTPTSINKTIESKFIAHDLIQTLILTVLAIGAQLCVYYLVELKHFQFKF